MHVETDAKCSALFWLHVLYTCRASSLATAGSFSDLMPNTPLMAPAASVSFARSRTTCSTNRNSQFRYRSTADNKFDS